MQVDVNFAPPSFPSSTQPIALSRVHSVTRASVAMGEADVARVVQQVEELLVSGFERGVPALQREAHQADGFLPIASLLHYSPLGPAVWPFGGVGVVADCLRARGSMVVELSGDGSAVRKMPLRVQLRNQLECLPSPPATAGGQRLSTRRRRCGQVPLFGQQLPPRPAPAAAAGRGGVRAPRPGVPAGGKCLGSV